VIDVTHQGPVGARLEIVRGTEGVDVRHVPPRTTLLVQTVNSVYRVVITHGPEVCIQGGVVFPEPTVAWLVGSASVPGGWLKVGWIGTGFRIELRSGDHRIVTSLVRAIAIERPAG
jgi:hypothetical protein